MKSFKSYSNSVCVKIRLQDLLEIEKFVNLGLLAEGYITAENCWLVDISQQELKILKTTKIQYKRIEKNSIVGLKHHTSFISGEINTYFNLSGCKLTLSYWQSKKLSSIDIQIFDLEGVEYGRKLVYNTFPNHYFCVLNSKNWPSGIYLVQIENSKQEKIQKVFKKNIFYYITHLAMYDEKIRQGSRK